MRQFNVDMRSFFAMQVHLRRFTLGMIEMHGIDNFFGFNGGFADDAGGAG